VADLILWLKKNPCTEGAGISDAEKFGRKRRASNLAVWRRNVWSIGDRLGPLFIAELQFRCEGGAIAGRSPTTPRHDEPQHGRCLLALVTHVLLRLIACRMEPGLLVIEHRAEIAHVCACCDKR
jgi:hypothetical protein